MNNAEIQFEREPAEVIADILGRWTVTDLREMSDDDLDRGLARYEKEQKHIRVLKAGKTNLIRWWNILSNGNQYQTRRFENFVWCSCLDFFFSKTVCKHIFVTTKDFTRKSRKEMDRAPYLKNSNNPLKPTERVGGIRI